MKSNTKRNITNFFGGVGYFLCSLQWLFVIVIYSSFIKSTLTSFTPVVKTVAKPTPVVINLATNMPAMIIAVIFTAVVVIFAIFVFIKIPSTVAKTSAKIVHEVAESTAPVVLRTQHIVATKQTRKKVVFRMTIIIKAIIVIVPLIAAVLSQFSPNQVLDFNISMYLSVLLAVCTTLFFLLQYVLARLLSVSKLELR